MNNLGKYMLSQATALPIFCFVLRMSVKAVDCFAPAEFKSFLPCCSTPAAHSSELPHTTHSSGRTPSPVCRPALPSLSRPSAMYYAKELFVKRGPLATLWLAGSLLRKVTKQQIVHANVGQLWSEQTQGEREETAAAERPARVGRAD